MQWQRQVDTERHLWTVTFARRVLYSLAQMFGAANITDEQVAAAANGAGDALDGVLRAVEPQVRLMVAARLCAHPGRQNAVDEVTHLVMVALGQGIGRLERRTVGGLKAYASGITARKVADHLQRRGDGDLKGPALASLDSTISALSQAGPLWQALSAGCPTPASAVVQADECEKLLAALANLKPEYREIITLAFFDQLPTREIAERLGVSRPAASMQLIRAIKTLRRNLTGSSRLAGPHEPSDG